MPDMPRGPFRLPAGVMPVNKERGGAACKPHESGGPAEAISAHVLMGSGHIGACTPSVTGNVSRWHDAEGITAGNSSWSTVRPGTRSSASRPHVALPVPHPVPRPRPAAVDDLTRRLTEAYLAFVCTMVGINEIEGYRRYQTDVSFKGGIDALVNVALSVVEDTDVEMVTINLFEDSTAKVPEDDPMWDSFQQGLRRVGTCPGTTKRGAQTKRVGRYIPVAERGELSDTPTPAEGVQSTWNKAKPSGQPNRRKTPEPLNPDQPVQTAMFDEVHAQVNKKGTKNPKKGDWGPGGSTGLQGWRHVGVHPVTGGGTA